MIRIFLLVFGFLMAFEESSYAKKSKIYLGVDGLNVSISHHFGKDAEVVNPNNADEIAYEPYQKDSSTSNIGFGVSLGHIGYYRSFFVAPEVFFDYFNSNAPDFFAPERGRNTNRVGAYKDNELGINYRYGAKLNLGVGLFNYRVGLFGTVGFAGVDYEVRWFSSEPDLAYRKQEFALLYGGGINFDVAKHLMIKIAYDYQRIDAQYVLRGFVDTVDIHVARIGVLVPF